MMDWNEILEALPATVSKDATVKHALQMLNAAPQKVVFVTEADAIIGYVDGESILEQIEQSSLGAPITYKTDMLKVPCTNPVEFYHNVSIVLGVNQQGEPVGFTTFAEARNKITQTQLHRKNQIFHSSGIGLITTDCQFRITFINERAEAILGLSRNFLLNRNYKKLLAIDVLEEVLQGGQLVNVTSSLNFKQMIGNFSPLIEHGKIQGIVHIFYQRQQLEQAIQDLELVRNLNDDIQAIYSSSNEEILVMNGQGRIMRLAGTYLQEFWMYADPHLLIGKQMDELQKEGFFRQNILQICRKQKGKHVFIQENAKGRKVWSVATPVFHGETLEKIVIISRDITELNQLKEELETVKKKSDRYKQELDQILNKTQQEKKLIYRSKVMENLEDQIKQIALVNSTVLLYGQSGVGKEVFAQAIHKYSRRSEQPLIRVNCGAIPENLIESEFFGYEKGAFTGADRNGKPGLFELAHNGSIFLDEITEMPLNMQVKLLRVLQEREITRIGGVKSRKIDVRVIAATNRDIKKMVEENKFREDLYYRLNVIPLHIPALRERVEDIISLSIAFLQQYNDAYQRQKTLTREALDVLESYHWPGNVRELQNVLERSIVTTKDDAIKGEDVMAILYGEEKDTKIKPIIGSIVPLKEAVDEVEGQLIRSALQKYGTAAKAAEILGISQATMSRKIKQLL
ncbi:PAS domain S-box protein [Brevibacillus fluminis]|uniref:HTH-type transcriptional regulatory protein TyrR n=1 Tax=Brevibacillus fluminis TaxID=511487 RepID=A0A3M8DGA5_9BACL|nr:sigma 54-interacting transcriptional regulator [Brevibacillus fluminis]RNB87113.1 PAS domain S-box protein [Brevibacillus fluminis]